MSEDAKGDSNKGILSKKRKLQALFIVINMLLVSFVVIWYFYLRPWSIRDVAGCANVKIEEDNDFFAWDMEVENPGFAHDLVGKSKIVRGIVTDISTYETTLGPITYYELDDFSPIRLVEWDYPRYKIGNEIQKKVHFEWSHWNGDKNVYSPQLDFPTLGNAPKIGQIMWAVSCNSGLILEVNSTPSANTVRLTIFTPMSEGFPLELFGCSLRAGKNSWQQDYIDVAGGYKDMMNLDSMTSISNITGHNNVIRFYDKNLNGILDNGDYFTFNLSTPNTNSAVLTFLFSINGAPNPNQRCVLYGLAYIVMIKQGVFRHLSAFPNTGDITPYFILHRDFEHEIEDGISTQINVIKIIGFAPDISSTSCYIFSEIQSSDSQFLSRGVILNESGLKIEFSDFNDNGLLDSGDTFVISGLENLTEYEFRLVYEGSEVFFRIADIKWQTGIGAFTGFFPIIDFSEAQVVENQGNSTFKIEVDRMYGIPGINLTDMQRSEWLMMRLIKDGQEMIPRTNLTLDFAMGVADVNLSFNDTDENNYLNSKDHFFCRINESGEYQLIFDYVELKPNVEERYEVIYSQSISWTA